MSKITTRVGIRNCVVCASRNATFHKLTTNVFICSSCKEILEKKGEIKIRDEGKLVMMMDGNVGYVPPEPKQEEIVEDVEQK